MLFINSLDYVIEISYICRHNKAETNKILVKLKICIYKIIPDPLYAIGKYEDDLVLEVVVLLGTAAADEGCAMLLCKADILLSLIELLKGKQDSPSRSADSAPHIWHIAFVWIVCW